MGFPTVDCRVFAVTRGLYWHSVLAKSKTSDVVNVTKTGQGDLVEWWRSARANGPKFRKYSRFRESEDVDPFHGKGGLLAIVSCT